MTEDNNKRYEAGIFKGSIEKDIEYIRYDIKEIKESLKAVNNCVVNMKIKMAGIGAVVSIIVTLTIILLKEIMIN